MFNRLGMFDRSLGMFQPPGSIPFNPSQIFAALQGAWLEPTPGYIWQENTGVTPTTTGGQTIGKIADQSGGGHDATQSTAANRPTYQFDSNGLPLVRHDTTDSLVVSLPSINVRRNLLTYSEQFDNGVWIKSSCTLTPCAGPDGTVRAFRVTPSAANWLVYVSAALGSAAITLSVWMRTYVGTNQTVDLFVKNGDQAGETLTCTVTSQWQRFVLASPSTETSILHGLSGKLSAQVDIFAAQLELGSVATDYQKITDWTSEAYSSNGSVYFSTPVGMSALHNQSMGTTYQLPALSTDIYSWIVVPQRLSTAQESRLERYMLRKAGLVEPDYLLDDDGNQLMSDDYELLLRQ